VYKPLLVFPAFILFSALVFTQQSSNQTTTQKTPAYAAIPVEAAKQPNPVKSTPESLARAKKWWALDCEMCHGKNGDGKGETAKEMKLQIADFTNPATLKDRSDGELFYIIKNGHNDMPAEGPRIKTEENWDLVNYIRSLPNKNAGAKQ
jgi:mono/diheme cytochrome c family protein